VPLVTTYRIVDVLDNILAEKNNREKAVESLISWRASGRHCALLAEITLISEKTPERFTQEWVIVSFNEAINRIN
jgi:hypothetical protein